MPIPYWSGICQFHLTCALSANCSSVVIRIFLQRFFPIKSIDNPSGIIDPEWDYLQMCIVIIGIKKMHIIKSKTFSLVQLSNRINDNNIVLVINVNTLCKLCSCFPQIVISWSIVISQSGFILVIVFLLPWTEINCVSIVIGTKIYMCCRRTKQMYTMKSKTFSLVQLSNRINDNNIVLIINVNTLCKL
jgi:hypothetical protein